MPKFTIGRPVKTADPNVEVTVSRDNPLPPGNHRFQLVVTDDSGQESEPAVIEIIVIDDSKPTAIIDGPPTVSSGSSFLLSGRRSTDLPPGRIVSYSWLQLT